MKVNWKLVWKFLKVVVGNAIVVFGKKLLKSYFWGIARYAMIILGVTAAFVTFILIVFR